MEFTATFGLDQLLWKSWEDQKLDPLFIVGKEKVRERRFNKLFGRYERKVRKVPNRYDVENDGRKPFVPHQVPASPNVMAALKAVKRSFPNLPIELLLVPSTSAVDMTGALDARCPMTDHLRSGCGAAE